MLVMYLTLIDNPTDREKFTQLYKEHRQVMFYFANQILQDEALAEDAVHDAFLRLAGSMSRFDLTRDAKNLLLTIVRHIALTMKSRRSREMYTFDSAVIYCESESYNPEEHYDTRREMDDILRAIDSMPYEYGAVFRLRFLHDMPYSDIARALDITPDTARKRIQRIRALLRKQKAEGGANGDE